MSRTKEGGRLDALKAMPGTINQITGKTNVCYKTSSEYVRELRNAGRAHIGNWDIDANGKPLAIYFAGWGIDAPKSSAPAYVRQPGMRAVIAEPVPARYDDAFMPRAFFVGKAA